MTAQIHELYGMAWVEFRDEDTRRYLGKLNVHTGQLIIPHRGKECRFDVTDAIKAIIVTQAQDVAGSK